MNGKLPSTKLAGRRIRLVKTTDAYTELKPGAEGTVDFVDDIGTVHVKWDCGSFLGMIWSEGDRWTVLQEND